MPTSVKRKEELIKRVACSRYIVRHEVTRRVYYAMRNNSDDSMIKNEIC